MVRIAQLMILIKPIGVENIVIFAIRAAVSEMQLILTLNGLATNCAIIIEPSIQFVWNFAERLLGAQGSFWKSRPKFSFVEIWHHHSLYGQHCPINESLTLLGSKIYLFFAMRAAVSDIQLFLPFRGKLALISTN